MDTKERASDIINYDEYIMSKSERLKYIIEAAAFLFVFLFIFYQSIIFSAIGMLLSLLYPKIKKKELIERRKKLLTLQFKEGLYSLSAALSAGRSLESAFVEAVKDLKLLYQNDDELIIKEFEYISAQIALNVPAEEAVSNFAERSGVEDIKNFADVLVTCKRTGGDLIEVTRKTSDTISDKIEIEQDIETLVTEKKLEQKVMNIAPIALIAMLTYTAGDFIRPLFTTIVGRIVMTVALVLIVVSYCISKKIMNIEV